MLIGYIRISTDSERQNLDLQRDALIAVGVDGRHIFEDKVSGARDKRVGLEKALQFLQRGDCLVVWKLDRLGRSLSHLLSILNDLHARGVHFRSLTEQMDTTTAHGELLFSLLGAMAQYERALIRERVVAGLEAAKRRGKRGGRPRAVSDEKLQAIADALKLGTSKAEICRNFGVKRRTLYDALERVG